MSLEELESLLDWEYIFEEERVYKVPRCLAWGAFYESVVHVKKKIGLASFLIPICLRGNLDLKDELLFALTWAVIGRCTPR